MCPNSPPPVSTVNPTTGSRYLSPEQVCDLVPGMTKGTLAQLRFLGTSGLPYLKPTPKRVVYRESDVIAWLESSARTGTAQAAA